MTDPVTRPRPGRWGVRNPATDPVVERPGRMDLSAGYGMRASLAEGFDMTVTNLVGRQIERTAYAAGRAVEDADWSGLGGEFDPYLDPETATQRYGLDGALTFDRPVPESLAAERFHIKRLEIMRQDAMGASDANTLQLLAAGMAGSVADPAAGFAALAPAGALARLAPGLRGMAASQHMGSRVAARYAEGAAVGAGIEAIIHPLATSVEQRDYTIADSLINVVISGGFGAIGGIARPRRAGGEGVDAQAASEAQAIAREARERIDAADLPATPQGRQAAMLGALEDIAHDRPVEAAQRVVDVEQRQRAQDAGVEGPPIASVPLSEAVIVTPRGRRVAVEYALVEADDLIASHNAAFMGNRNYPESLQPRDRTRADMRMQVEGMARDLDPARLGESPQADTGAPVIARDGVVESGNGRAMAIRRAYDDFPDSAQRYRAALVERYPQAATMERPVLARVRTQAMTGEDRIAFTREANESAAARLSASEQASGDAQAMDPNLFALYQGGPADAASNRAFAMAFLDRVASPADRNVLTTREGALSGDGMRRINDAITAYAWGDIETLMRLGEGGEAGFRGIANALRDAAPEVAALRAMIRSGDLDPASDPAPHVMEALSLARAARDTGDLAERMDTIDAWRGDVSPHARAFARVFYTDDRMTKPRSRSSIADILSSMARETRARAVPSLIQEPVHASPRDALVAVLDGLAAAAGESGRGRDPALAAADWIRADTARQRAGGRDGQGAARDGARRSERGGPSGERGRARSPDPVGAQQDRASLEALIAQGADADTIAAHPIVRAALDDAAARTPTSETFDFSSDAYVQAREFSTPDGPVQGVLDGLRWHRANAERLAWTDDGLPPPPDAVAYNRELTFVIGYPAAGKSSVANPVARHRRAAILDSDEFKKTLPEYEGGAGASAVHRESSFLADQLLESMMGDGINIVWPRVGDRPAEIAALAERARARGYEINIVWMDTPQPEAMRRMVARGLRSGRFIPPQRLAADRLAFAETFDYMRDAGRTRHAVQIDGSPSRDIGPHILQDQGGLLAQSELQTRQTSSGDASGAAPARPGRGRSDGGGREGAADQPGLASRDGAASDATLDIFAVRSEPDDIAALRDELFDAEARVREAEADGALRGEDAAALRAGDRITDLDTMNAALMRAAACLKGGA